MSRLHSGWAGALLLVSWTMWAGDPPEGWIKRVAEKESANELARSEYTYKQVFVFEETTDKGIVGGHYREEKDVTFLPDGSRDEKLLKPAENTLQRIKLTEDDFNDIRHIQPALLTVEDMHLYQFKYRGEEEFDGHPCWLLGVKPRQLLYGMRLFEGMLWVDQKKMVVVKMEGQAVPPRLSRKEESLFPTFVTVRREFQGGYWFPVTTYADDVLPFRTGPIRVKFTIRYSDYKKFGSDTKIEFAEEPK